MADGKEQICGSDGALNTELIVMGTLCENALEHVMQALQEDNDALNREIIILGKRTEEKRAGSREYLYKICF